MSTDDDKLVRRWTEAFTEEVLEWARPQEVSNEEVFAEVYHSLIHSPISGTMLQLEHSHASTVEEKLRKCEAALEELDRKQNAEMAQLLVAQQDDESVVNGGLDDEEKNRIINELSARHFDERQMAKLRFDSDLSNVRDTQYREFREWVMCVHDEYNETNNENNQGSGTFPSSSSFVRRSESGFSIEANSSAPVFQESFTITLGAQMKQMHNLRLVAADALDLCRYSNSNSNSSANNEDSLPQRLQTSMSLYSNNLCGVVLLTDRPKCNDEFSKLCSQSTEFHFPTYEQQLEAIFNSSGDLVGKCMAWRREHQRRKALVEGSEVEERNLHGLTNGDFFVTRHSNLCEVHVIFHMICDDSVLSGSINSRHPVVMGLRNVLKTASLSDVTTLTIPLLLTMEMHEVMTVAWCVKRAELVFKCVKGFMMEVSSWGGSEIKTLQFLVPKDLDREVFNRLTNMLAGIFRTSNPIRGR